MILDAYIAEHPDGHVSVESCECCENEAELEENLLDASDEDEEDDENEDDDFWTEVYRRAHTHNGEKP